MTPRGADVGHCRLNLAVLFSVAAADDYLAAYERAADVSVDPAADLRAVLNFDRHGRGSSRSRCTVEHQWTSPECPVA